MVEKIILGTVQLGLQYGIHSEGKPDAAGINNILSLAYDRGVKCLDTAVSYGNAIDVIGDWHRKGNHQFEVISKFKTDAGDAKNSYDVVVGGLVRLDIPQYEALLYHSFSDFASGNFHRLMRQLKDEGITRKTGVSLYTNEELALAVDDPAVDIVQLPFNLLDNASQRKDLLLKAKERGKEVHIRSVFLQGLFFMPPERLPATLKGLKENLLFLRALAVSGGWSMEQMALGYAVSQHYIDKVLIGVDNPAQLSGNLDAASVTLSDDLAGRIDDIRVGNIALLHPVNW